MRTIFAVAALLAAVETDGHGGLVIPPCRNNHGNVNLFNFTKAAGEKWLSGGSCAGDMCLWFNDGCFIGCPNCTSIVSVLPGASGEVPDRFIAPNCNKPTLMEPTLPEEYRTWNIGNVSEYGDWTKYHPWRAPASRLCQIHAGGLELTPPSRVEAKRRLGPTNSIAALCSQSSTW